MQFKFNFRTTTLPIQLTNFLINEAIAATVNRFPYKCFNIEILWGGKENFNFNRMALQNEFEAANRCNV